MITGLQHDGWQVEAQPQDLAAPQQPESNRPACATLPNPSVATTAVKVLIQFIKQRLLPLGLECQPEQNDGAEIQTGG